MMQNRSLQQQWLNLREGVPITPKNLVWMHTGISQDKKIATEQLTMYVKFVKRIRKLTEA